MPAAGISEALVSYLSGEPAVANLCGARISPLESKPKAKNSRVVYMRGDHARVRSLAGRSGLTKTPFTLVCYGNTAADARMLAAAVFARLDVRRGFNRDWDGITVQNCKVEGDADQLDEPQQAQGGGSPSVTLEAEIWWVEGR